MPRPPFATAFVCHGRYPPISKAAACHGEKTDCPLGGGGQDNGGDVGEETHGRFKPVRHATPLASQSPGGGLRRLTLGSRVSIDRSHGHSAKIAAARRVELAKAGDPRFSSLSLPSHENLAKEARTSARCVVDGLLNMAIKKPCHLRLPPQPPWPKNRVLCTPPNRTGPSWFIEGRGAPLRIHGPICRCASIVLACFLVPKLSPGSNKLRSLEKNTLLYNT